MTRIVTNVQSLIAQRVVGQQNVALNQSLTRLSTGLRINTGADDPAGLIGSESLRSDKVAINAAVENARRADNFLAVAEGGLQEVNALLLELEDLLDRSANEAGLSDAEVEANQAQIDAILSSIDRIANTSTFNGQKLLGGNFEFTTSGVNTTNIDTLRIDTAKIPEGATRTVTIDVVAGSDYAVVSGLGGGTAGALSAATTIEVTGNYGSEVLSFASGTTAAQIAAAVNTSSQLTGISAIVSTVAGTGHVIFASTQYGADAVVSVEVLGSTGRMAIDGTNTTTDHSSSDNGVDGTVIVNGRTADVNGLDVTMRSGSLSLQTTLGTTFGSTNGGSTSFAITGGGAVFSIAPQVNMVGMEGIGLQSVSSGSLGGGTDGFLSTLASGATNDLSSRNFATAQRVIRNAQEQVSSMRGRIGAFQKDTLQTTVNSLLVALENTAAAESAIRETDFAEETSALTRAQILVNSSMSTLQIANAQPQSVLSLLQ